MEELYKATGEEAVSVLAAYREVMSIDQLERYGEYLLRLQPARPFSASEIASLRLKKEFHVHKHLIPLKLRSVHEAANKCLDSLFESRELLRRASELSLRLPFDAFPVAREYRDAV